MTNEMKVQSMKNGIKYLISNPICSLSDKTSIYFYINTGSIYEVGDELGISHFIEHLYFNGTCKSSKSKIDCKNSYTEIFREIDTYGGEMNAYTDKEHTLFHITIPNKFIKDGFELISDLIKNTKITDEKIEKEKKIVIEEENTIKVDSNDYVHNKLMKLVFGDNQLSLDMIGGRKYILNYTRKMVNKYINKFYYSNNSHISISTNISNNVIQKYIRQYFSDFRKSKYSIKFPEQLPIKRQLVPRIKFYSDHDNNCIVSIGYLICGFNHEDKFALKILSNVIGEMYSSRLFTELRDKNGLVYDVESGSIFYDNNGVFIITCSMDCKNTNKTVKLILNELENIKNNGILTNEFNAAKNRLIQGYLNKKDNIDSLAEEYGLQLVYSDKVHNINNIVKHIKSINKKFVEGMAHKYLDITDMNMIISGKTDKKFIKNIVKDYCN